MKARTRPYGSFWMMFAIAAILPGLSACGGDTKQEQKTPSTPITQPAISGTITLDPALKDKLGTAPPLLMIIASTSSDPSKPALVAKREADARFPYDYKLTADDITLVGSSFVGKMYVTARIDPAGMVGPPRPGTFDGTYSGNPVPVGSSKIDIVINKAY